MRVVGLVLVLLGVGMAAQLLFIGFGREASAPSERIVFTAADGSLHWVSPDGNGEAPLLADGGEYTNAQWSPSGRQLAVYRRHNSRSSILLLSPFESRPPLVVTPQNVAPYTFTWSPDGAWIVFDALVGGQRDLVRIRPNGTDMQTLTPDAAWDSDPVWSADGEWIYFVSERETADIFRMRPDGSGVEQLTFDEAREEALTPSPDGKWLLYQVVSQNSASSAQREVALWIVDLDTNAIVMSEGPTLMADFRHTMWSPDSQWIYFQAGSLLMRMRRDGTAVEPFLDLRVDGQYLSYAQAQWSPDGEWLVFDSAGQGTTERVAGLYRIRQDGSDMQPITTTALHISHAGIAWQAPINTRLHPARLWVAAAGLVLIGVVLLLQPVIHYPRHAIETLFAAARPVQQPHFGDIL